MDPDGVAEVAGQSILASTVAAKFLSIARAPSYARATFRIITVGRHINLACATSPTPWQASRSIDSASRSALRVAGENRAAGTVQR